MANRQFFNVLAWIGLIADLISLGTFIFSGNALQFWSPVWFVGIAITTVMLAVTIFLFSIGNSSVGNDFMPLVAGAYAVLSCVAFLIVFVKLSGGDIKDFENFAGFAFLVIYPTVAAYVISQMFGNDLSELMSYAYATCALLALIGLMIKYLMNQSTFALPIFSGEVVMLLGIGVAFLAFHENA